MPPLGLACDTQGACLGRRMSGFPPRRALLVGGAALAVPFATRAQNPAAPWPRQPIRLIVPFAPGGTTDLVARLLAQGLQDELGQPVIIENRAGAAATLGSQMVAQATPDGHTLLVSNIASHGAAPSLYRSLRYDAVRDFTHIALVVQNPLVFVATPRFPATTLAEVVRLSREESRGIDIASSGSGSTNHLLILQFGQATGAHVKHIPYRGAGPAMTDTIAGIVPMMSDSLPSAATHIRAGMVRALALSSDTRHPAFPAVPTFREQGVDLVSTSWFGLSGPAGLPPGATERLAAAAAAVLAEPALRARFAEIGGTVGALGPAGYTDFVRAEVARWAPVVQASGAQVD
ncbi:Bug family tripartite tricarboxylate transporter substrate binding protein [Dankookia sp. GCM10030260]|uniref:Bug family tripartite tricarboxylate transporter substrate binding protein n=1 Tax=Dankookia sp. GCM10030260 TaxID=3273390 RepID=UPI00361480FF